MPQLSCCDAFMIELDHGAPEFRPAANTPQLEFGSGDGEPVGNDWFDLSITVRIDDYQVPIASVITELASGATHMLLPNGVYFPLATPELLRLRELISEARALGEIEGDTVNAGSYNVTLWDELLALGVVDKQVANIIGDSECSIGGKLIFAAQDPPRDLRNLNEVDCTRFSKDGFQLARRMPQEGETGLKN